MLADGVRVAALQAWLAQEDLPVWARNTISRHKVGHNRTVIARAARERSLAVKALARAASKPADPDDLPVVPQVTNKDLAVLVRDRAVKRILDGDLDVTVTEGLRAQDLLDRRLEKQGDRDLILNFVGMISGAAPLALPEPTTEAEYREIGPGEA